MKSTRWKVFGVETDTRVAEFKIENPDDQLMTYEEAKASALQRLKDHVAPYLARIEELEQDVFAETGALPPLRAWKRSYGSNAVITAKTKKRAAELAEESLYGFNIGWDACEGDWWYHLAREEAVWIEEQDDQKQGTGVFYKPLAREEAEQIVEQTISPYRTMSIDVLLGQVGRTSTVTGGSSQGTPYKITTRVERGEYAEEVIFVRVRIDDFLNWKCPEHSWHERYLSKLTPTGAVDWAKEGF